MLHELGLGHALGRLAKLLKLDLAAIKFNLDSHLNSPELNRHYVLGYGGIGGGGRRDSLRPTVGDRWTAEIAAHQSDREQA
jgi:hypothetical protein